MNFARRQTKDFVDELLAFTGSYKEKHAGARSKLTSSLKVMTGWSYRDGSKTQQTRSWSFMRMSLSNVDSGDNIEIEKEKTKGIVLLHGLPGTGKTTYLLRYLIGRDQKKVLFLSPDVARQPWWILILYSCWSTIRILCWSLKMRRTSLWIAKWITALRWVTCLTFRTVCSRIFECSVGCAHSTVRCSLIDSALMRKGRLIAKYEFGKLGIDRHSV